MDEDLEGPLERAAEHRRVTPGSVAAAELGGAADAFSRTLGQLEQNLLRAAAAFDGELDTNPRFNELDYLLEKLGRVEQDAAELCHILERSTGRPRRGRLSVVRTSPSGALDAAAARR